MYEIEGLREGIERCKVSIKTFQDAINRELETIEEYKGMIAVLEKKRDDNTGRSDSKS